MNLWHQKDSFKTIPWKNGGGETIELFKIENPCQLGDFLFRLSIAKVDKSGPFSLFPGVDRILLLLSGPQLVLLRSDGEKTYLSPMEKAHEFQGEESIQGQIQGICWDFNVMTKRSWGSSKLEIYKTKIGEKFRIYPGQFLYQLSGELKSAGVSQKESTLWEVNTENEVESLSDSTSLIITILRNSTHKA